jgi:hypothetical protein
MPVKKTKKKQKQVLWDFHIDFNDLTMKEAEGQYSRVKQLMEAPQRRNVIIQEPPSPWVSGVVKTNAYISSQFGQCVFRLDFYHDRRVAIVAYAPSVNDMYLNPDIRALSRWCQENGWKVPEPTDALVRDNLRFWKYMWNTLICDSAYLDQKYGIRKSLDMRAMSDEADRADRDNDEDEL